MSDRQPTQNRVFLSVPHMGDLEEQYVKEAFTTNWITPLGPHVDAFEAEFCQTVGAEHALALSSGTAAMHLALQLVGVGRGDEILASTLTFIGSVNPILYLGAIPVFIDSEHRSWNMDPGMLEAALTDRRRSGRLPKAVNVTHLYGQSADIDRLKGICDHFGVPLVEDAAESLGSTYKGRSPGTFGRVGIYSFNGNKMITTGGGGMLVSADGDLVAHARKLATQAREPVPHYEHIEAGYNYRLSNVLAAIGRGQLHVLAERVAARRRIFDYYVQALGDLPGLAFMPEAPWGRHTRWLSCVTIDTARFGVDREAVRLALAEDNIEARPVWKPMHLQPLFANCQCFGGAVAEALFRDGLCLPSGSSLTPLDLDRVVSVIRRCTRPSRSGGGGKRPG